jgi:hypothetical protein
MPTGNADIDARVEHVPVRCTRNAVPFVLAVRTAPLVLTGYVIHRIGPHHLPAVGQSGGQ